MLTKWLVLIAALYVSAPLMAQDTPKEPNTRTTPAPNQNEPLAGGTEIVTPDYPLATWVPANPRNFQRADRPNDLAVNMVIIHDIEGSAEGCLSWFQNPQARATSHYVVDSMGRAYQMVKEHDVAWHAGNRDVNQRSVGIENNGYAYRPGFFNTNEYEGLAKLVRDITIRHQIPRDREHIIGHNEVPNPSRPGSFGGGSGHTDPGPYWNWDSFMTLVKQDARLESCEFPKTIHPGELIPVTVKYTNTGDDLWTANNSGREDENVAAKGGVYLGTWAPFMHVSPFFNHKFTTSPTMLSSVTSGDCAPGAQGTFSFSLLGPRTLGKVTEQYRVTQYPAAPKSPTAFGDVLAVEVSVEPWSLEFAAGDAGFTGTGWTAEDKTFWREAGPGDSFVWTPSLAISGNWDVYARWPDGRSKARKVVFAITGQKEPISVTVDQRKGKRRWIKLGRFAIDNPKAMMVTLTAADTKGRVVADALKFEGPFPMDEPK
jgi:hypothetical protein